MGDAEREAGMGQIEAVWPERYPDESDLDYARRCLKEAVLPPTDLLDLLRELQRGIDYAEARNDRLRIQMAAAANLLQEAWSDPITPRWTEKAVKFVASAAVTDRIIRLGDPDDNVLHQMAKPVTTQRGQDLSPTLFDIMARYGGVGLAAPQIGLGERVAVISIEGYQRTLVNPRIVETQGITVAGEGCLSIPGLQVPVYRAEKIRVVDESGEFEIAGIPARIIQHEVDHLDGITIVDRCLTRLRAVEDALARAESSTRCK